MRNVIAFFALIAATLLGLFAARAIGLNFNAPQIASITIFSLFIYGTLLFGEMRLAFAFGGIALLLGLNLLTVDGFTDASNLRVIVFLIGMFLVIGFLEENQFFEHIVEWLVRAVGPRPRALLLVLMVMATVSAALVDEVTSILFMSGTMLHLTSKYRLNPVPFIIMLVFATNIGSAASSIGNPIGVMIAFNAGFSFLEFLRWSAPVALVVNVVTYFICRWWYSESFTAFAEAVEREHALAQARHASAAAAAARIPAAQPVLVGAGAALSNPGEWSCGDEDLTDDAETVPPPPPSHHTQSSHTPERLWLSWAVFAATILLLITHGWSEHHLGRLVGQPEGLPEGTMMMGAALLMGAVVLVLQGKRARELVERRVDWWTLSFFMMLFASVGTLEHTGVTRLIAERLIHATGGNATAIVHIVGWATGWLSAFLDNVLAVATFMPVIHDIRLAAAPQPFTASIYWMMLFGGTFMGNMTLIGSTANIIALGVLEKRGHGTIRFWEWFKIGLIVSIASMIVAATLLQLQSHWVPNLAPPTAGVKVGH